VSSQTVQFLSRLDAGPVLNTRIGAPQVNPPSVERLTRTSTLSAPGLTVLGEMPSQEISQTLCFGIVGDRRVAGPLIRAARCGFIRCAGQEPMCPRHSLVGRRGQPILLAPPLK